MVGISDEFLERLPDDPVEAFPLLVDALEERLQSHQIGTDDYEQIVRAFLLEYDIMPRGFGNWEGLPEEYTENFRREVIFLKTQFQIRKRRGLTNSDGLGLIALNDERKQAVHKLINKIRKIVAVLDVTEGKRNKIYDKLNALSAEIDRTKTRWRIILDGMLELSTTGGEGAKRLEPAVKQYQEIMRTFADQKAEDETAALPKAEERQMLPPPPKPGALDDELPF